jgi:hypothetical protein
VPIVFDQTTATNNSYRLRLQVDQQSYNATANTSYVVFTLTLQADGLQWFDGWSVTGNVDYAAYDVSGNKGGTVEVWNAPTGQQSQGSAGNDKVWASVGVNIAHDSLGRLRLGVFGDFKTNTSPGGGNPAYLVPYFSIGSVNSINTTTVDNSITPSAPSAAPTLTRTSIDSSLNTSTLNITSAVSTMPTNPAGMLPIYEYAISSTSSTTGFGSWVVIGLAGVRTISISVNATGSYWIKTRSTYEGTSGESLVGTSLGVPNAPTITSSSRSLRKITLNWTAPTYGAQTSYVIQARYSSNGGTTWDNSFTTLGTAGSSAVSYETPDLLIAKTYQLQIYAVNAVGNGLISQTQSPYIFISAYGYRKTETSLEAVVNSKIFIGVGQAGADATGWKVIENVKRFIGVGQPGADADGWTELQT